MLVCLLIAGVGAAYNVLSLLYFRHVAGVPGKLYDVGGYSMHLYCTGTGSPTVLLSSGLGDDFTAWARVQPVLAGLTRVCSYDRAGFGWSESRPGLQDANAISSQLHQLVQAAGIQRPFVLVGHSISGIYLRYYAAHYPGDLAGLVFIDGATPLQDSRIPKALLEIQQDQRREMPWQKLLMTLGWYRLRGDCTSVPPGFEAYTAWIRADSCVPSQIDAIERELDAEQASGQETIRAGPFGNLPILILSRDPGVLAPNWPASVSKANAVAWNQMQEEAKGLSTDSLRIIAKGSLHYIMDDRPDLVSGRIASFIVMIRDHQSFANNHATVEE
ncbi:MAG TPA: alpha/beta hydrolase [Steroidobacteraceae bacterium]|nr:alpha/beta hydrolase [Steroidobacteraceae bacterium]